MTTFSASAAPQPIRRQQWRRIYSEGGLQEGRGCVGWLLGGPSQHQSPGGWTGGWYHNVSVSDSLICHVILHRTNISCPDLLYEGCKNEYNVFIYVAPIYFICPLGSGIQIFELGSNEASRVVLSAQASSLLACDGKAKHLSSQSCLLMLAARM